MPLQLRGYVDLPRHATGGFDHGDVHLASGRVFVAHTANDSIEVIDGPNLEHERTLGGCPEGSGVLCTQADNPLVFAAARGAGKVIVLDALEGELRNEIAVGPMPNGLAWAAAQQQLLVADVEDYLARIVEPRSGRTVATIQLPGRPRWSVFDAARERFLINIREPSCVVALALDTPTIIDVSAAGPHGLDIDPERSRAFVACDAGMLAVMDLATDREIAAIPIAGEPDAIWFNASRNELYVAIGSPGLLDVVDCELMQVAQRVETEHAAHTTAFDAHRQLLYVFLPGSCRAAAYNTGADG
jgi:DNA-binding beta-propeller fold protein YncE